MKGIKYIFALAFLVVLFSCQNKQKIKKSAEELRISATLNGYDDNTSVKLIDGNTNKIIDCTKIVKSHFTITKRIENAPKSLFLIIEQQAIELFVGNENIKISGEKNNFPEKITITGSENQNIKTALDKKLQSLNSDRMRYLNKMFQLRNENKWNDKLQKEYWGKNGLISNVDKKIDSITKDFIFKNINTDFALNHLIINKPVYSKNEIRELLNELNEKYKNSKYGIVLNLYVNNATLQVDNKYVDFKGENQEGKNISFSSLLNNDFTLLEFASPHCSWCKQALPMIKRISEKENISIVTMWVDRNKNDWKEYYKSNNINWTTLWDRKGKYSDAYTRYNIYGTPTYFLINKKGIIVKIWKGYNENMEDEIEKIINNAV